MSIINRYSETKAPKKQKLDGTISDNQEPTVFEDPEKHLEQSQTAELVTENLELHQDKLTGHASERHLKIVNQEKVVVDHREFHEVANIFPLMRKEEFNELKNDISENGLREPIWLDKDGKIIEGKNRYLACRDLGVPPKYRTFDGEGSLLDFVISMNLKRRHLTQGQRAFIAVKIADHLTKEAKERQREAGKLYGKNHPKNLPLAKHVGSPDTQEVSQIIEQPLEKPNPNENKAAQKAAKLAGTNRQYVINAMRIEKKAHDVAEFVMSGKIDIPDALRISELSEALREELLKKVDEGCKPRIAIRDTLRATVKAAMDSIRARIIKAISGVYDVIVIDPPWEIPNPPYPTMTVDEIRDKKPPCADVCHVFLWTINHYLPDAFDIVKSWGLDYKETFVWHKAGGPQKQNGPQCNAEFVLHCTKKSPKFFDTTNFFTCFEAPRNGHSVKPEEFYDMVRRVTAGRKVDMYGKREIDDFDSWGLEAPGSIEASSTEF